MFTQDLAKPDGRRLTLYSRRPLPPPSPGQQAPSPFDTPLAANPHLRWHPLRGEWITYAAYRQDRTFLPPPQYNPLAPTVDARAPTEVPAGDWDIAVFDNRFPSLSPAAHDPPASIVPTRPATGACEVVVFTQDPQGALGRLPLDHIALLFAVWADRTERLAHVPGVRYVMPFENRGAEVGVTLHHPHGQIYAYAVVPPVPARMLDTARATFATEGRAPLAMMIEREIEDGARVLYASDTAVAFVPACARWPYEVWVAPVAPAAGFIDLNDATRAGLALALKTALLKLDGLWQRPMPYLMTWYAAPVDGHAYPEWQLHAAICPPYRTRERLKVLAGTELGAGFFAMDALPEDAARQLQAVTVDAERT